MFAKGIGAASILHAIMRQGDVVEIANQSMLIGDGWDIHAIYADRKFYQPGFTPAKLKAKQKEWSRYIRDKQK